ncbi:P-loop containing nucleoside triphosphate hydrolase protein [Hygrophoropsis aurantiaca]|uniref:P-loop containing nucleoside triphosphate hydrolase protein n=1 Tax=Hygrophoropsis aurantiaca TaxID=72124 RepID=A0ACB8ACB4_9AGAM|nr:P-loop containing nucleoside triphosphate hydrolase protein [Hygrophoropsis aurantiaca]
MTTFTTLPKKTWKGKEQKAEDTVMKIEDARDTDIIIPVMGPTGVGKSTFINVAAGQEKTAVGHRLTSCTANLQHIIIPYPGDPDRRIIFVDTPGFDDTSVDDAEILRRIAVWLARSYSDRVKLAGVLYLYNIAIPRFTGTTRKTLELFQKLCGDDACRGVILVTTHWAKCDPQQGQSREDELSTSFFSNMLDHGATCTRFDLSPQSAWDIINLIVDGEPLDALHIQKELVDLKKRIPETEAAACLRSELQTLLVKHENILRSQKKPKDMNLQEIQELKDVQKRMRALVAQIDDLKAPWNRRVMKFFGLK